MRLTIRWLDINENVLTETETYSDLDPESTSKWYLSLSFNSNIPLMFGNTNLINNNE